MRGYGRFDLLESTPRGPRRGGEPLRAWAGPVGGGVVGDRCQPRASREALRSPFASSTAGAGCGGSTGRGLPLVGDLPTLAVLTLLLTGLAVVAMSAGPVGPVDARATAPLWRVRADVATIRSGPAGRRLIALDFRGGLSALDPGSGQVAALTSADAGRTVAIALSPDGATLAAAREDGRVLLLDAATGQVRSSIAAAELNLCGPSPSGPGPVARVAVTSLAYLGVGAALAGGADDGSIRAWGLGDGRLLFSIRAHAGRVNRLVAGLTGRVLISSSSDGTVKAWDPAAGRCLRTATLGGSTALGMSLAPDEAHMAVAFHRDGTMGRGSVVVIDLGRDPEPDRVLDGFGWQALAFSPDGRALAGTGVDPSIQLCDLADGRLETRALGHPAFIREVVFAPGGRQVATVGSDGSVGLFDISAPPTAIDPGR